MESKKINQLATNVAPQTSDLTIIGDPITGVSKKITLLQIANLFATTGTVSSVAVTETGDALTITGSPITTAGTINIGFAGNATQYVRGDGALADFPTSTGGGSSVSYYLNSSVSQGTIGGVAYRELSKEPVSGAGTDITASTNGYIASYITDANDPSLLEVPGGNFNCEFYFSVNSNNHDPSFYAELYKYDGSTFTLLGSSQSVPEYLSNGTTLSPYYFAIPVATAVLSVTDRLAIRIYVNVDGRVVTLHTENNHLCQVVTTFSKGLTSLNNLTRQVQFFGTGTSGTDFAISSSTATHTFNLPVASATNTGKLSSTDWSTFNGKVPYTGATASLNLGSNSLLAQAVTTNLISTYTLEANVLSNNSGSIILRTGTIAYNYGFNAVTLVSSPTSANTLSIISDVATVSKIAEISLGSLSATRTFTLPDASGTLALTSNLSSYVPYTGATANVDLGVRGLFAQNIVVGQTSTQGYIHFKTGGATQLSADTSQAPYGTNGMIYSFDQTGGNYKQFVLDSSSLTNNTIRTYTMPNASGTIALLSGTQTFTGDTTFSNDLLVNGVRVGIGSGGVNNARFGALSFMSNTTGGYNTAIGTYTLNANTTGGNNTALGNVALGLNTTGSNNTAIGGNALGNITTGSSNIGLGNASGGSITTGSNNTIIGNYAGTTTMSNNIVLADGQGNVRYQWDGTNNVFGNPISGTSASFSSSVTASSLIKSGGTSSQFLKADGSVDSSTYLTTSAASSTYLPLAGGTLTGALSGTSATFSSFVSAATNFISVALTDSISVGTSVAENAKYNYLGHSGYWGIKTTATGFNFALDTYNGGTPKNVLTITQAGAATFSSSVTANSIIVDGNPLSASFNSSTGVYTRYKYNGTNVGIIGTANQIIGGGSTTAFAIGTESNDYMLFLTNNAERMRITSGGNLGIGTSSPSVLLHLAKASAANQLWLQSTTGTNPAYMNFINSGGNNYFGVDNSSGTGLFATGGAAYGFSMVTESAYPILFGTNNTERARITSGGSVLIGKTSTTFSTVGTHLINNGQATFTVASDAILYLNRTGSDGIIQYFYKDTGIVGSISVTTSATAYNTSSDYRLKEDLKEINGLEKLSAIKVYDFKWKADESRMDGVIAHELAEVIPYAVTGEKDGQEMQQVDYSKIVPILIKSIQELEARIKQLENK